MFLRDSLSEILPIPHRINDPSPRVDGHYPSDAVRFAPEPVVEIETPARRFASFDWHISIHRDVHVVTADFLRQQMLGVFSDLSLNNLPVSSFWSEASTVSKEQQLANRNRIIAMLRGQEAFPAGFVWNYQHGHGCLMGLVGEVFETFPSSTHVARSLGLSDVSAYRICFQMAMPVDPIHLSSLTVEDRATYLSDTYAKVTPTIIADALAAEGSH